MQRIEARRGRADPHSTRLAAAEASEREPSNRPPIESRAAGAALGVGAGVVLIGAGAALYCAEGRRLRRVRLRLRRNELVLTNGNDE